MLLYLLKMPVVFILIFLESLSMYKFQKAFLKIKFFVFNLKLYN